MTSVAEQNDTLFDQFSCYYISGASLSPLLQSHSLTGHPTYGNGLEIDQYLGGISTQAHSWLRIPAQDLIQFLEHDSFTEQPFASGNETPAKQNGTPSYSASWLVPAVDLYRFLQLYVVPANELPSSDKGHEIPAEQNDMPADALLFLIPAESLSQFLQRYEIPVLSSFDSGHEVAISDPTSQSVTPTQDSDDQVDAQLDEATVSTLHGCPVCGDTFNRMQERNRHVESYLPHSIFCPFQGCTWTGRRQWDFKNHWERKHAWAGQAPVEGASEIYDPKDFVKLIVDGTPVHEVARYVFAKSLRRLGRPDVLVNALGRNRDLKKWIVS